MILFFLPQIHLITEMIENEHYFDNEHQPVLQSATWTNIIYASIRKYSFLLRKISKNTSREQLCTVLILHGFDVRLPSRISNDHTRTIYFLRLSKAKNERNVHAFIMSCQTLDRIEANDSSVDGNLAKDVATKKKGCDPALGFVLALLAFASILAGRRSKIEPDSSKNGPEVSLVERNVINAATERCKRGPYNVQKECESPCDPYCVTEHCTGAEENPNCVDMCCPQFKTFDWSVLDMDWFHRSSTCQSEFKQIQLNFFRQYWWESRVRFRSHDWVSHKETPNHPNAYGSGKTKANGTSNLCSKQWWRFPSTKNEKLSIT